MDDIFDECVDVLTLFARDYGTTYKRINVWFFCIIEPIIFVLMVVAIVVLVRKLNRRGEKLRHAQMRLQMTESKFADQITEPEGTPSAE